MKKNLSLALIIITIAIVASTGIAWFVSSSIVKQTQNTNAQSGQMPKMMMDHSEHATMVTDDKSFILGMVPHHEEAVTSSQELLKVATTPEVISLAKNIIAAQQKEITDMKTWYASWFNEPYKDDGKYKPMMPSLQGKSAHEAEQAYLHSMIMHHEAALVMAEAILKKTDRQELKLLGANIIKSQNEEILTMKKLMNPETMMMHSSH